MAEIVTKACSLTEDEIKILIGQHGLRLHHDGDYDAIERINYLNKRLKAFKEPETETQDKAATAVVSGWGTT